MKTKDAKQPELIRMPELQINGIIKKIMDWVSQVRYIYWIIGISILLALVLTYLPDSFWEYVWTNVKDQESLIYLVLIFGVTAVSLIWKAGQRIDVWVFMAFNVRGHRPLWVDWAMLALTQLGNGLFAIGLAIIFYLQVDRLLAYELIFGTLTLWLVVEIMKMIFRRKRPYIRLKNIRIIGSRAGGHSFPSGHTSQAFFLATMIFQHFNLGFFWGVILYATAVIVGITRIYVGMHYPRDVLGGAMVGTAWGLLGVIINSYVR